jgi:hypothetical protein
MRLSDFILQNEEDKKLAVLHTGVLIGKRKHPGCIIFLFQLDNFYVETFCDTETKDITEYRAFAHTNMLHPYLESISIEELFSN